MTHPLITLEHGKLAYTLDFVAITAAAFGLGVATWATGEGWAPLATLALTLAGLLAWTLLEYLLHRFVLHGLQPFSRWHALHHQRPQARIYAPTWLSAGLIAAGILAPLWWLAGLHVACAVTLGVVLGNLGYALAHHAAHGGLRSQRNSFGLGAWCRRLGTWHLAHHGRSHARAHYGVSTRLWDHLFGTAHPHQARRRGLPPAALCGAARPADAAGPQTLPMLRLEQRESP
jgi:sterol desaturase/sphingolipid hydroxylase (fatty acid hydroxylase superfamily)